MRTCGVHTFGVWDRAFAAVVELRQSGRTLSATGSGRVEISGRKGCELSADLPFERQLPTACQQTATSPSGPSRWIAAAGATIVLVGLVLVLLLRRRRR